MKLIQIVVATFLLAISGSGCKKIRGGYILFESSSMSCFDTNKSNFDQPEPYGSIEPYPYVHACKPFKTFKAEGSKTLLIFPPSTVDYFAIKEVRQVASNCRYFIGVMFEYSGNDTNSPCFDSTAVSCKEVIRHTKEKVEVFINKLKNANGPVELSYLKTLNTLQIDPSLCE